MAGPKSLVAVFAHPDDEDSMGGTLAKAAAEGHRVTLICATRGEGGEIADPALATRENLGEVREQELRDSCGHLGVRDVRFLDYADGRLDNADMEQAVGRIVRILREVKADVVVTFEDWGTYGHPDHVAVNRLTTNAFALAGQRESYPEHMAEGLHPFTPAKLYYRALPQSLLAEMKQHVGDVVFHLGAAIKPVLGPPDEEITTEIDVSNYLDHKICAYLAHRTQALSRGPFGRVPLEVFQRLMSREYWVLAASRCGMPDAPREASLFERL